MGQQTGPLAWCVALASLLGNAIQLRSSLAPQVAAEADCGAGERCLELLEARLSLEVTVAFSVSVFAAATCCLCLLRGRRGPAAVAAPGGRAEEARVGPQESAESQSVRAAAASRRPAPTRGIPGHLLAKLASGNPAYE